VNRSIETRDIATGIVITSLIVVVVLYLPILGFFCSLLLPLPILFFRSKGGRKTAGIIGILSLVGMAMITGAVSVDLLFFVEFLLIGFLLGELFEKDFGVEITMLYTAGVVILAGTVGLFVYSGWSSRGVMDLISEYVATNLEMTLAVYEGMGVSEESIHRIASSLDQIQYVLIRALPALYVASTMFVVWTSLLLSKPIFRTRAMPYPDFGVLNQWKAPESLVWAAIGSAILLFLPGKPLKVLGLNGLIVLMMVYFFQGIAIVSFYFEKKKFPVMLRVFLYCLIALQQFLLVLVIGCGFFDMWLNFRKLEAPGNS